MKINDVSLKASVENGTKGYNTRSVDFSYATIGTTKAHWLRQWSSSSTVEAQCPTYIIGHFGDDFYRPDDQTATVRALKEISWSSRSRLSPTTLWTEHTKMFFHVVYKTWQIVIKFGTYYPE